MKKLQSLVSECVHVHNPISNSCHDCLTDGWTFILNKRQARHPTSIEKVSYDLSEEKSLTEAAVDWDS